MSPFRFPFGGRKGVGGAWGTVLQRSSCLLAALRRSVVYLPTYPVRRVEQKETTVLFLRPTAFSASVRGCMRIATHHHHHHHLQKNGSDSRITCYCSLLHFPGRQPGRWPHSRATTKTSRSSRQTEEQVRESCITSSTSTPTSMSISMSIPMPSSISMRQTF